MDEEATEIQTGKAAEPVTGWPDSVDAILAGDHVVALSYATPAKGAVVLPLCNYGVRDRDAGTASVSTSYVTRKKLERIRADPRVALAFHAREHTLHERPEYVLIQGRATISEPIEDYPATILAQWERFEPWQDRARFWRWWQRVYGTRVSIDVHVERIVVWPDLTCSGAPTVLGEPLPADPPASQRPPGKGTAPRLDSSDAARRAGRLPHCLLGWIGADGFPVVIPGRVAGGDEAGIDVTAAPGLVPPGGRRAGLTAHMYGFQILRQEQRMHTGWLEADAAGGRVRYSPHTKAGYRMPNSRTFYRLATGGHTRLSLRAARRAGA